MSTHRQHLNDCRKSLSLLAESNDVSGELGITKVRPNQGYYINLIPT